MATSISVPALKSLVEVPFGDGSGRAFMAMGSAATLLLSIPAGLLSDRLGRRIPLVALGLVGTGLCTIATPLVRDFTLLLGVRFLDGALTALALAALFARVGDLTTRDTRAMGFAVVVAGIPVGYLLGQPFALALGDRSLPLLFGLVGLLCVAGGAGLAPRLGAPERVRRLAPGLAAVARAFGRFRRLWIPFLFSFVDKFTFGCIAVLLAKLVGSHVQAEVAWAAVAAMLFWVGFLACCWPAGLLARRIGLVPALLAGSAAYGVCLVALGPASLLGLLALKLLLGMACAFQSVPTSALAIQQCEPSERGAAMGAVNAIGSLGMVFGLVIGGYLELRHGFTAAFAAAGLLEIGCALAVGLALLATGRLSLRPERRPAGPAPAPAAPALR